MERIVIEVDKEVAKAWRKSSADRKRAISNEINVRVARELLQNSKAEYLRFLDELQSNMRSRGLTEDVLNDILNEK
ncbi:MAG: hypothetical protein BroJett042_24360 [Bacteroidota bacterium]|nr:MAG: hypothetical protein UZ12_BCD005001163 [Bacteroidetes bacterium OLB12]MCE7864853.1 hypothetical protein [Bacteroidetes bacterium CHB5]GIL23923.1 MAG: hypothetical protein BroJett042_24360 [Bacteroidota bacterium]HNR73780.1 hypothetical protein [Cyclobacteriaceae bacterium]HNU41552.1 hypothetical protein [Cyclobacteriaceae bacterium]